MAKCFAAGVPLTISELEGKECDFFSFTNPQAETEERLPNRLVSEENIHIDVVKLGSAYREHRADSKVCRGRKKTEKHCNNIQKRAAGLAICIAHAPAS